MTDKSISTETFYDIPVRVVHHEGTPMIPLVDIAMALNYDRGNMTRLLKRNAELFEPYKGLVQMTTPGGIQELVCLSEEGVVGLLMKMDYSRVKDKTFRTKVLDFQRWAVRVLKTAMKQDIVDTYAGKSKSAIDLITESLDIADIAIGRCDVKEDVAYGIAWATAAARVDKANKESAEQLTAYASYIRAQVQGVPDVQLLPAGTDTERAEYESHYSLTQVADYLKKSPETVKKELERLGVTYFQNGSRRLTKMGEQYGKVFMVTPGFPFSTQQRPYIKYNPDVLILLRKSFDGTATQKILPQHGGGA